MTARTVLALLPGNSPCQRLQVSLRQERNGKLLIELCEQHHAEGIGWFDQRALPLSPQQFRQLQGVLNLKSSLFAAAEQEPPATLPFPGPRSDESDRTARDGS